MTPDERMTHEANAQRILNSMMDFDSAYRAVITINKVDGTVNENWPVVIVPTDEIVTYLASNPAMGMLDYVIVPVTY